MMRRRIQLLFALLALMLFFGGLALMRSWAENWGATAMEQSQALPGDEFVPAAARTSTMAITVNAPVDAVWPWIAQFGAGRGGLYTYDWFERLILQCQVVDSPAIMPEHQSIKAGDPVRMCAGDFAPPGWTVVGVEPGRALILGGQDPGGTTWTATDALVVLPIDAHTSRLFLRNREATPRSSTQRSGPGFSSCFAACWSA